MIKKIEENELNKKNIEELEEKIKKLNENYDKKNRRK